jgi:hypothetical protein
MKGLANGKEGVADGAAKPDQRLPGQALFEWPVAPERARVQPEAICSAIMFDAAIAADAMEVAKPSHWRANSA